MSIRMRSFRKHRLSFVLILLLALNFLTSVASAGPTSHIAKADDEYHNSVAGAAFLATWVKADGPVAAGLANRSWLWGPGFVSANREDYKESPDGTRFTIYFDKARMEVTNLQTKIVTNGLLVVEMMSGKYQEGDSYFVDADDGPAKISVVGDSGNWLTYAKFASYASLNNDNRANNKVNQTVDSAITEHDGVVDAGTLGGQQKFAYYDPTLGHNIPKIFWDYLNQSGTIFSIGADNYIQGQPINWLSDVGYPITEAYWVKQVVGGELKDVMVQAFQRRTLTFTPDNPLAYQIEMGNVGRHYLKWAFDADFPAIANPITPPIVSTPTPTPLLLLVAEEAVTAGVAAVEAEVVMIMMVLALEPCVMMVLLPQLPVVGLVPITVGLITGYINK